MVTDIYNTEHYVWGDECDGWHLVQNENLNVIQERMPANTAERKHYHEKAQQYFYVLEGVATMEIEEESLKLYPRQGIHVAPLQHHKLINEGDVDLVFLVISTPKSHGDRVPVDN